MVTEPARTTLEPSKARLGEKGRLVIPAAFRVAMGIEPGDEVILRLAEDGTLEILTPAQAVAQARAILRRHVPAGRMLSDELIADRRAEAERE